MKTAAAIDDENDRCRHAATALRRLCQAVLLGCLGLTGAQARFIDLPVVAPAADAQTVALDGRVAHLVDPDGEVSVAQLRAAGRATDWARPADAVRSGADGAAHWFKLRLRPTAAGGNWVLALPDARNLHEVKLIGPCAESGPTQSACDGATPPQAEAFANARSAAFLVSPQGAGTSTYYLRTRSALPQNLSLSIGPFAAYDAARQARRLAYGTGYGLMLGLVLFGLLLWWTFRERVYLRFMLDLSAALATVALYNGQLGQVLFPTAPWLTDRVLLALLPLWIVFGLRQALVYLKLRQHMPWLASVLQVMIGACVLATVAALAGGALLPLLLAGLAGLAGMLGPVLLAIGSKSLLKSGHRFTPLYLFTSCLNCWLALLMLADLWALLPAWVAGYHLCQWATLGSCLLYAGMFGHRLARVWMRQGELRARAAEFSRVAATDPLTGLANRLGLKERAGVLFSTQAPWTLLLVDLDRFKPINDSFGHETGDRVLVAVAGRLRASAGPHDLAVRLGGDEFALLLTGAREGAELAASAQDLIDAIRAPIELDGRTHRIGASIGVARAPFSGSELSQLLRSADEALYRAKRAGRGCYAFFEGTAPLSTATATL